MYAAGLPAAALTASAGPRLKKGHACVDGIAQALARKVMLALGRGNESVDAMSAQNVEPGFPEIQEDTPRE